MLLLNSGNPNWTDYRLEVNLILRLISQCFCHCPHDRECSLDLFQYPFAQQRPMYRRQRQIDAGPNTNLVFHHECSLEPLLTRTSASLTTTSSSFSTKKPSRSLKCRLECVWPQVCLANLSFDSHDYRALPSWSCWDLSSNMRYQLSQSALECQH